jgi:predicted N-acetyltransferase YhbS
MNIQIRPMDERDVDIADRTFRVAFGTFLGLPDPPRFMGDAGFLKTRFKTDPSAAFVAESNGEVVGSNVATNWGSVGVFGPLTVRPDLWGKGISRKLMEPVMQKFSEWKSAHLGLFTFSHSPKHVGLYQKYDFWPRYLTAIMVRPTHGGTASATTAEWKFSGIPQSERVAVLKECRGVTSALYDGLDLTIEIDAIGQQHLGETVLLWNGSRLEGFAACHIGPGTEAGSGACYVKFAAIRPGPEAASNYDRLMDGCDALGHEAGCQVVMAGANMARSAQYRAMLAKGFKTQMLGVAMEKANQAGYNRPDVFIADDWR